MDDQHKHASWRQIAAAWLTGQEAAVVIMAGVLAFHGYIALTALPALHHQQREDAREARTEFLKALAAQAAAAERRAQEERQDFIEALRAQREDFQRNIDRLASGAIQKLHNPAKQP